MAIRPRVASRNLGDWYDWVLPAPLLPIQIYKSATGQPSVASDVMNAATKAAMATPGWIADTTYSAITAKPAPSEIAAIKQQTCADILNAGGSQADCQQANNDIDVTIATSGPPQSKNPAFWLAIGGLAFLTLVALR